MMEDQEILKAQWEQTDRLIIEEEYKKLLETPVGRKFLNYLLQLGKFGQQPFDRDPIQMGFNCGELNVGQRILIDIVTVNPYGFTNMQQEATDEHRTRSNALSSAGRDTADD